MWKNVALLPTNLSKADWSHLLKFQFPMVTELGGAYVQTNIKVLKL